MTLNEIAVATINWRGYLVICTDMNFPRLPYSLHQGLCETAGEKLDSASLYAYERTDLADFLQQREFQRSLGMKDMIDPHGAYHFYRVRGD